MHERKTQERHGRATTLYPRTLELLEREDLFDHMAQVGFFGRNTVTFRDGKIVPGRGWLALYTDMKQSFHAYHLNIRQKYSEDIFRSEYEKVARNGAKVRFGWEMVGFEVDKSKDDGCNITVRTKHVESGEEKAVRW